MSAQVVKERKQWWYGGVAKKCNFASSSGIRMAAVLVERRALMEKKRADAHHANYSITILTDGSSSASGTANEENLQGEKTAFACQGTRLHLKCLNQSEVIKVTRANYGRFSIAVCNDKSMTTWSVNCFSSKAKEVFANKSVPQKIYLLSFLLKVCCFLFAVAITLPNVTSWLKTLISVQIPALIRNGTLKPATSASPEAKTTTRVRPLKKSLLLCFLSQMQ